jgi:hypothetical protein
MRSNDVFKKPRNRAPKALRESTIQRECVQFLVEMGCTVAITDAGAAYGIPAGWPDITGLKHGGRFIGVECKTAKGRQSEDQKQYQSLIESRGGIYFLVRSLEDLKDQWARQNILDNSH